MSRRRRPADSGRGGDGARAADGSGTSIRCDRFVELVTDYVEGALDPAVVAEFEAHLAACPGCTEYLHQMRQTTRALGRVSLDGLPDDARARLLEAFGAMFAQGRFAQGTSAEGTSAEGTRG